MFVSDLVSLLTVCKISDW